ncbi:MAG: DUF1573 domain-containing protein [Saprospiraceae bacterium]|nr:DUF1573 domain-containing protein [Saprospiraceae bacterium]
MLLIKAFCSSDSLRCLSIPYVAYAKNTMAKNKMAVNKKGIHRFTTYDKKPIAPGKTTEIRTTYNPKGLGSFKKTVSVHTNLGDKPTILTLTGGVK